MDSLSDSLINLLINSLIDSSHLGEHGSGDLKCTECDAVFRFSKLLNRHVLTVHKQLKVCTHLHII